jgi:exfoliative toxin A/B
MSFIRRIPVPIAALALALATLGNLLANYSPTARLACGVTAAVLATLAVARLAFDFRGVMEELRSPAVLAVAPTFPMALMVLSTYLKPVAPTAAFGLWVFALGLQLVLVVLFVLRVAAARQLASVLPSWFIVFVGYVVGAVTSPAFSMQPVGTVLLYAGLVGYVVALPAVVYRMVKLGELPAPALPTIAIFTAPTSLCLVGYLAVTDAKQAAVVYALLALSALSLLFVIANLPRIAASGFHPGFAALTFPVVITAVALKQSAAFMTASGAGLTVPPIAVSVMDAAAVLTVAYVFIRYVFHLAAPAQA